MFFLRPSRGPEGPPQPSQRLREVVAHHMDGADDTTVALVGAVAALLALVAHADRHLDDAELDEIRAQLGRVDGLASAGVEAVLELLTQHAAELVDEGIHAPARVLADQSERPMRLEVLDVLMDVAAADGKVSMDETNLLRRITTALRLEDAEYLAAQARYRDRLSVLDTSKS